MTLADSEALSASVKIQYFCALLRGEALRQLDTLFIEVVSTTTTHLNLIILG